jgi:glycerophosphoryl diester phosphodiesterase
MSQTPGQPIPQLAVTVVRDLWRALRPLVVFEAAFKAVAIALGALGAAWVISPLIESTGRAAVTNTDIARFLLSPAGVTAIILLAFFAVLGTMIEHVGVIAIAAIHLRGRDVTLPETLSALKQVTIRLATFGIAKILMLALLCAPFVILAGISYLMLLSSHDINYYLANQPPSWYEALGIGAVLAAALVAMLATLYVSSIFVVPILLFEERPVREAVRQSRARTRGSRPRIAVLVLGWQVLGTTMGAALIWGFDRAAARVLNSAGSRPIVLICAVAILLALHALMLAGVSFVAVSVQCLLILRLYLERGGALGSGTAAGMPKALAWIDPLTRRLVWRKAVAIMALPIFVAVMGLSAARRLNIDETIVVVAHRGYSRQAPENSLSAFRKAIEVGADVIELDVQETADGVVVVLHDRDLMRLAGDSRPIAELSFADARQLDISRRVSPELAGERIPTLEEAITLARGKIKLQIELKYYGKDRGLAEKVAALIAREHFEGDCEISSLDYEGLMKAKRANPRLKVVALVTYALGDPGRLDVDALSVNTKVLSDRLISVTRSQGKELYAWTVDDSNEMVRLIERGVGRLVTNSPEELIRIRRERAGMTDIERRVLAARYLLGLENER